MSRSLRRSIHIVVGSIGLLLMLFTSAANAQSWRGNVRGHENGRSHGNGSWHRSPPVVNINYHPTRYYERGGHWAHTWHGGRFGWWWVLGPHWAWYERPVVIAPEPQREVIIVNQRDPEPAQVVAAEPPQPTSYYFCESSQLYYPFAKSCSEKWKIVPAMPEKPD